MEEFHTRPASASSAGKPQKPTSTPVPEVHTLPHLVVNALEAKKAEAIKTISLEGKSSMADALIIASGTSERHLASLAQNVMDALNEAGYTVYGTEGMNGSDWVIVDAGDILIHLFLPEAREKYHLEKMWSMTFQQETEVPYSAKTEDSAA